MQKHSLLGLGTLQTDISAPAIKSFGMTSLLAPLNEAELKLPQSRNLKEEYKVVSGEQALSQLTFTSLHEDALCSHPQTLELNRYSDILPCTPR